MYSRPIISHDLISHGLISLYDDGLLPCPWLAIDGSIYHDGLITKPMTGQWPANDLPKACISRGDIIPWSRMVWHSSFIYKEGSFSIVITWFCGIESLLLLRHMIVYVTSTLGTIVEHRSSDSNRLWTQSHASIDENLLRFLSDCTSYRSALIEAKYLFHFGIALWLVLTIVHFMPVKLTLFALLIVYFAAALSLWSTCTFLTGQNLAGHSITSILLKLHFIACNSTSSSTGDPFSPIIGRCNL